MPHQQDPDFALPTLPPPRGDGVPLALWIPLGLGVAVLSVAVTVIAVLLLIRCRRDRARLDGIQLSSDRVDPYLLEQRPDVIQSVSKFSVDSDLDVFAPRLESGLTGSDIHRRLWSTGTPSSALCTVAFPSPVIVAPQAECLHEYGEMDVAVKDVLPQYEV